MSNILFYKVVNSVVRIERCLVSQFQGQTSIFGRRTMPSAAISSLAHMPGCVFLSAPSHDSNPNRSNAVNRYRVISILF